MRQVHPVHVVAKVKQYPSHCSYDQAVVQIAFAVATGQIQRTALTAQQRQMLRDYNLS